MCIEGSVEDRRKSLNIFFIDPNLNLILDVSFIDLLLSFDSAIEEPDGVVDVEFEEIFFIAKTEMMENAIVLVVLVLSGVDGGVFLEVLLHFEYVGAAKNKLGDLILALHYYR